MRRTSLQAVVHECDRVLCPESFTDWENAFNGLQVANRDGVTRIVAAVDASLTTVRLAIESTASLLLVHHGLFWSRRHPWTGVNHELMRCLVEGDLAVYSAHLPLDAHPRLGNNALLCRSLGLRRLKPFFVSKGRPIGFKTSTNIPRDELATRLAGITGGSNIKVLPGGPPVCRNIGVVSGGAGGELKQAVDEGVDTFITGEGPHWTFALAEELGINVLYGGHYATETFGVKALAEHLSRKFALPWGFLDHPTGL